MKPFIISTNHIHSHYILAKAFVSRSNPQSDANVLPATFIDAVAASYGAYAPHVYEANVNTVSAGPCHEWEGSTALAAVYTVRTSKDNEVIEYVVTACPSDTYAEVAYKLMAELRAWPAIINGYVEDLLPREVTDDLHNLVCDAKAVQDLSKTKKGFVLNVEALPGLSQLMINFTALSACMAKEPQLPCYAWFLSLALYNETAGLTYRVHDAFLMGTSVNTLHDDDMSTKYPHSFGHKASEWWAFFQDLYQVQGWRAHKASRQYSRHARILCAIERVVRTLYFTLDPQGWDTFDFASYPETLLFIRMVVIYMIWIQIDVQDEGLCKVGSHDVR